MSSTKLSKKELIALVLVSFEAERTHRIADNKALLHSEFKVTDMVLGQNDMVFPAMQGKKLFDLMDEAFMIKGREFIFINTIADEETQTVIVEFVESYPDPKTKKVYRTPQVAICQIKDGKIYRTRHYMDPRLSYEYLNQDEIDEAMK